MTFRNQLKRLNACPESIEWVKDKTIEEAWATCENSQWMLWVLTKTNLDLIDPICDILEEVLYLVPEDGQLACIWAISAVKRRANIDELDAAWSAATAAYAYYARTRAAAARTASEAAAIAAYAFATNLSYYYAEAAHTASYVAYYNASDADHVANTYASSKLEEKKKQCDIIRKHFTIDQVKEAFNKLVS